MIKKIKKYVQNKIEEEGLFNLLLWEWIFRVRILLNTPNIIMSKKRIKAYLDSHDKVKVHIGCGGELLEGFLNTDILGKVPVDVTKKLPFPKESVDLIYSNQLLEHIYYKHFKVFLKESYRVLKKGGMQIITVPSIEKIMKSVYGSRKTRKALIKVYAYEGETLTSAALINRISRSFMHKFLYDYDSIKQLGEKVGFQNIYRVPNKEAPDKTIKKRVLEMSKNPGWPSVELISETYILVK